MLIRPQILILLPMSFIYELAHLIWVSAHTTPLSLTELTLVCFSILVFHCPEPHLPFFELSLELIPRAKRIFADLLLIVFPLTSKLVPIAVLVRSLPIPFSILYFSFINLSTFELYSRKSIKVVFTKLSLVLDLPFLNVIPAIDSFSAFLWHMQISLVVVPILVEYFRQAL